MRPYRGKRKDNGEWVYGGFHKHQKYTPAPVRPKDEEIEYAYLIIRSGFSDWNMLKPIKAIEVIPETVGQYTGLKDCNKQKVYKDDIIEANEMPWIIQWNDEKCYWEAENLITGEKQLAFWCFDEDDTCHVVGNRFDNSKLLEGE